MNFMGIDIGTTSVKTAVFDETLEQKISLNADYTLDAHGDIVEFDGEAYWSIVKGEMEKVKKTLSVDALAVDTQCETLILTDENGVPVASFYFSNEMVDHLADRDFWVSHSDDVLYVKDDIIINEVALADIDSQMDAICSERDNCFLYLLIHEQYFYEKYFAYEPDYKERIFATVDWCHRHGYTPETLTNIMEKNQLWNN